MVVPKATCEKEKKVAINSNRNLTLFFQNVNSEFKPKENISGLLKEDGSLTECDLEKAEILNGFYSSVLLKKIHITYLYLIVTMMFLFLDWMLQNMTLETLECNCS